MPPVKDQLKIESGGFASSKPVALSGFLMSRGNMEIHY
jgi:hypothetical protein